MTTTAYERLRQSVLHRLDQDRIDPRHDPERVRRLVTQTVGDYQRMAETGGVARLRDVGQMAERLVDAVTAYGPLTEILLLPDVEEVFIEGS